MRRLQGFALACVVLAGCDTSLDRDKLVGDIEATLKEKGVPDATVHCPEVKKLTSGQKFQCGGGAFGKPFQIDVVVTDDKGTVKWDLVGKIIETDKLSAVLQPKITAKIGTPAVVSCAENKLILAPKDTLTCDITADGESGKIAITVADNGDDVSWKILK
ncbi:MAG: DUF4333 domain-containing protein [Kofleriaceae bacterium]